MNPTAYDLYATDSDIHRRYLDYQARYATTIRESDKVLIEQIRLLRLQESRTLRVLDVGCSTGNLLLHLARMVPGLELTGLDLRADAIGECRANPDLTTVHFETGSAFDLPDLFEHPFDIVVANAMVHHLSDGDFARALVSFSRVLAPGGHHLNFDGFHPFEQEVATIEYSPHGSPSGIPIHYRSFSRTTELLRLAGFDRPEFHPFEMPFDLVRNPENYTDLTTYTIRTADGHRMSMRGVIHQTWCHMYARCSTPATFTPALHQ